jgi:hypothetical protein
MYQITNLNLIPGSVLPVVNVSQYDKGRQFQLLVSEGEYAYDLTGKTVTIRGTKPDMHGFDYGTTDGVLTVAGNVVNVFTTQQMTAVAGQVMAELRIASGSTILGTINFIINVEESALSDDTILSDTEIPVIERDFEAALAEAEADALVAEGYAKGTQDGTPVGSGSPYYHDNAKYYKEQAEEAASGVLEKYPKIVSDYWYIWDVETNQYVNTGVRAKGTQGDPGEGVPAGGSTGQVLRKKSDDSYDTEWANGGGGASALDDLTDVDITSPASGDGLLYDGAEWVNGAVATPDQIEALEDAGAVNKFNNTGTTQVLYGVTWTVNADKTVTADSNGSPASGNSYFDVPVDNIPAGAYIFCASPAGGDAYSYLAGVRYTDNTWDTNTDYGGGIHTNASKTITLVRLVIIAGYTANNVLFKPMISDARLNLHYEDYQPYAMTNKELTEKVAVKTGTVTSANQDVTVNSSSIIKKAGIVTMTVTFTVANALSSGVRPLSFSDIFRPTMNLFCPLLLGSSPFSFLPNNSAYLGPNYSLIEIEGALAAGKYILAITYVGNDL